MKKNYYILFASILAIQSCSSTKYNSKSQSNCLVSQNKLRTNVFYVNVYKPNVDHFLKSSEYLTLSSGKPTTLNDSFFYGTMSLNESQFADISSFLNNDKIDFGIIFCPNDMTNKILSSDGSYSDAICSFSSERNFVFSQKTKKRNKVALDSINTGFWINGEQYINGNINGNYLYLQSSILTKSKENKYDTLDNEMLLNYDGSQSNNNMVYLIPSISDKITEQDVYNSANNYVVTINKAKQNLVNYKVKNDFNCSIQDAFTINDYLYLKFNDGCNLSNVLFKQKDKNGNEVIKKYDYLDNYYKIKEYESSTPIYGIYQNKKIIEINNDTRNY